MSQPVTREAILRIAAEQFGAKGFRGTRLDDVAAELGVTRQALYYYYSTKQAILVDLYTEFFDRLQAALDEAEDQTAPSARFDAMLAAHIRVVAEAPELSAIFTQERNSLPPDAERAIAERRHRHQRRMVDAYQLGIDANELRGDNGASVTVSLLVGAANWIFRWYRADRKLTPEQLAKVAVDLLAHGYRVPPAKRARGQR